MKKFIGIDISQSEFVVATLQAIGNGFEIRTYSNDDTGVSEFVQTLDASCHCVLEATGNYSLLLSYRLASSSHLFSVINPKSSIHFRQLMGQIWKDDSSDASLLSMYGQRMNPSPYELPTESLIKLKQRRALLRQLKKQKQALENFLHSLSVHPLKDILVEKCARESLNHLVNQIKEVQASMGELIRSDFAQTEELICSIKGIGPQAAWALIEATQGFTAFDSARQFAKYIGIAPTYVQSGSSVRMPSRINRSGDPQLRALLYICSWSALRYNSACKEIYDRLKARGKPSKVSLVAVMNKLIRQVFAVVKKGEVYQDDFEQKLRQKWNKRSQIEAA